METRIPASERTSQKLNELLTTGIAEGSPLEPGEAVLDVGRVVGLALLAVVDDVETRGDLPADDVVDGGARARVERGPLRHRPLVAPAEQRREVVRTWQAADVRGRDPGHRCSSLAP